MYSRVGSRANELNIFELELDSNSMLTELRLKLLANGSIRLHPYIKSRGVIEIKPKLQGPLYQYPANLKVS